MHAFVRADARYWPENTRNVCSEIQCNAHVHQAGKEGTGAAQGEVVDGCGQRRPNWKPSFALMGFTLLVVAVFVVAGVLALHHLGPSQGPSQPSPSPDRNTPPGPVIGIPGAPDTFLEKITVDLGKGVTMAFVHIPAAGRSFQMGSPKERVDGFKPDGDEGPVVVSFTRDFWMAEHETTQAQYEAIIKANPSEPFKVADPMQHPVQRVCWKESSNYAEAMTHRFSRDLAK